MTRADRMKSLHHRYPVRRPTVDRAVALHLSAADSTEIPVDLSFPNSSFQLESTIADVCPNSTKLNVVRCDRHVRFYQLHCFVTNGFQG